MHRVVPFLILCLCFPGLLCGATYYVDPVDGDMNNSGTVERPWKNLAEVLAGKKSFSAGDKIILCSGYHGAINLSGENEGYVTIEAIDGEVVKFSRVKVGKARFWCIKGIRISPEFAEQYKRGIMVDISKEASDIAFENCVLFSTKDSSGWSAEDWVKKSCFGFIVRGSRVRVASNRLLNVSFGISVDGDHNIVEDNVVENFSGDGMRALGDDCIFRHNVITNCYDVDDNHDDGIQSWSVGEGGVGTGVVKNVVIEGNLIINYTDPNQKYRGTLQGIGCFDGFYENWVIANNIVVVDHWHGITLGGARNCKIINNTVVDLNERRPGPPWIVIDKHKNGSKSTGNIIRNNLAKKFISKPDVGQIDHNVVITDYDDFFVDYGKFDFRLKAGCAACDAGANESITAKDFLRNDRLGGERVDAGAIEFVGE